MLEALVAWDAFHPATDQFLLSKGHCVLAYYVLLALNGKLSLDDLAQHLTTNNHHYILHPSKPHLPEIFPLTTGSLGHALSFAAGRAYAAKVHQTPQSFTVMLSDGEFNIGQTYEALLSIAHLKLNNITILIDLNHWQALGRSEEVLNLRPLEAKLASFGYQTTSVAQGNDLKSVSAVFRDIYQHPAPRPTAVILHTVKGFSLPQLADTLDAHYRPATPELIQAWAAQQTSARPPVHHPDAPYRAEESL